jgi:hypothetical protein
MAGHADFLRRSVKMGREIASVRRVAEITVAVPVRRMLDTISGLRVAGETELSGGRRKGDIGCTLDVGNRVAGGATHGDRSVNILAGGLVVVTLKTLGRIEFRWQKDRVPAEVGTRSRSRNQQEDNNRDSGENNRAVARVRKRH